MSYLSSPFNDFQYSAVIAIEIKGETGIKLVIWLFFLPLRKFNPFPANVPFLYPLKTSENQRLSDVFRGYRNETFVRRGLNSEQQ